MIKATLIDSMGSDLSVVNAARVSFGKTSQLECTDWKLGVYDLYEKDARLIKYLAKHKHMSPFGHAFASFHVKAPIFVARQLVKHKFLRWNEISRRYVDDEPEFYVPEAWRGRSEDKKQGSSHSVVGPVVDYGFEKLDLMEELYCQHNDSLDVYDLLLKQGVAPEQARMVLPQSTMTEWWWSGSLDAFADMCNLRLKEDTQYESRLVAQDIDKHMKKLFPHSWDALIT